MSAPTISGLVSDIAFTEDTLGNLDLSALSFIDADNPTSAVVTLTAAAGIMTAQSGTGVGAGVAVVGTGTNTVTLTGSFADINTYLDTASNIKYQGASNVNGDDATTLSITANDMEGSGDVALGVVNLDITAVNDDPTVSGLVSDITTSEEIFGDLDLSATSFADVDSAGDIIVTLSAGSGTMTASNSSGVVVGNSGTGTLTFTGTITELNTFFNTASNVQYKGATDTNGDNTTTVTVTANDGDGSGDVALGTVNMDITAVNDDPVISGLVSDITTTEDVFGNLDLSATSFADVDSAGDVVVTLTASSGIMTASSGGGVIIVGSTTSALTLFGTFTDINTYLNDATKIQYKGASNVNGDNAATVTITANDGDGSGNVALGTVNIDITTVNDDPAVSGLPSDVVVASNTASNLDLSASSFADVDSAGNVSVSLTAGTGTMTASSGGGVIILGSTTSALTLFGTFTDINTYLDNAANVQYTGAVAAAGNNADTITITVNDDNGSGDVALGTVNVDITAPPIFTNLDGDIVSFLKGQGAIALDAAATADNNHGLTPLTAGLTDADSSDFDGGVLTVSVTGNAVAGEDLLSLASSVTIPGSPPTIVTIALSGTTAGSTISVDGTVIGTLANDIGAGNDLVINLDSNANAANVQTLVGALQYENTNAGDLSTDIRTVSVTLSDGDGYTTTIQDITVNITTPAPGEFSDSGQTLGSSYSIEVTLGDVDGDGDLDMVVANYNEANKVWLNDGSGGFSDSGQSLGSKASQSVTLGDIDGDGDLDMIVANYDQGNKVWLNDGSGGFSDSGQSLGSSDSIELTLGDIDGDGDLDMVVANYTGQGNTVWLNDGSGGFSDSGQSLGTLYSRGVTLGDVDGDGDLDMVVANQTAGNTVWLNDGSGDFGAAPTQSLGSSESLSVTLGDVDGDGDLDMVIANYNQGNTVWLNDGSGNFGAAPTQSLGTSYSTDVTLGDLDGDGDLDMVVTNTTGQANTVWLNDGSGSFTQTTQTLGSSDSWDVTLGDLDGDGDLDMAVANADNQANSVYLNNVSVGGGSPTPTNELIPGSTGNDSLAGGSGNDTIQGGEGEDTVLGGAGNDELRGGQGNDELRGSTGDDTIYSGQGDDLLVGGQGNDLLDMSQGGNNEAYGLKGNDTLTSGSGNDTLQGGEGNDVVTATSGDNVLLGGMGDDVVTGGSGNDLIRGGNGTDTLTGGDGVDIFQFTTGQSEVTEMGADQITDFVGGVDQIDTPGVAGTADNFSDLGSQSSFDSALAAATTAISTATGVIYVETEIGGVHYLFSDDDGDGTIDMAIQVGNDFGFADIV